MKYWMFNCREVSRKLSESMDRTLPLSQRLMMRFHFAMCRYCARLQKQLLYIRQAMRADEPPRADDVPTVALSQNARERLSQLIKNAVKESG